MTSPFKTFEEFSEAEGPIYTFANSPAVIGILLVVTAVILVYFLYISYTMKQEPAKGTNSLGAMLLASALSLAGLTHSAHAPKQAPETARRQAAPTFAQKALRPLALLGLVSMGATGLTSTRKTRASNQRSRRSRSRLQR